jgi:hypothetical protein
MGCGGTRLLEPPHTGLDCGMVTYHTPRSWSQTHARTYSRYLNGKESMNQGPSIGSGGEYWKRYVREDAARASGKTGL